MWAARDKDGQLCLFTEKPCRRLREDGWQEEFWDLESAYRGETILIDSDKFPNLTWNDEPIKVKLNMTAEEIISRLRKEIDRIYEDYEGTRMVEEESCMEGFEQILNDYYEDLSLC